MHRTSAVARRLPTLLLLAALAHCSPGGRDRAGARAGGSADSVPVPAGAANAQGQSTAVGPARDSAVVGVRGSATDSATRHQARESAPVAPGERTSRAAASPRKRAPSTRPDSQATNAAPGQSQAPVPTQGSPAPASVRPADSTASTAAGGAGGAGGADNQWLTWDAGSKTAKFKLEAGPFKFDGYSAGGATLTLPPQANVIVNFINKDGTPHSAVVIDGQGPLPNMASDPVIPGAYTVNPLQGLPQEGTDVMRFKSPDTGTYRIVCGVPGHALSGMWLWMKIDPSATAANFGPTK